MKNIYLYGYSDDLLEVDSDFGLGAEIPWGESGRIKINTMTFAFLFTDAWDIAYKGVLPRGWKLYKIDGLTHDVVIHLQIPDSAKVEIFTEVLQPGKKRPTFVRLES
jgi:hypothetical protein